MASLLAQCTATAATGNTMADDIRNRVRKARARQATTPLLDWKPGPYETPPDPAITSFAELQRFWDRELKRHGFDDVEDRNDGRLREERPRALVRGQFRADTISEHADYHQALCRAWWRMPDLTSDEREVIRMAMAGRMHRTIALELHRRKAWVGQVIQRAVAWGVNEDDAEEMAG